MANLKVYDNYNLRILLFIFFSTTKTDFLNNSSSKPKSTLQPNIRTYLKFITIVTKNKSAYIVIVKDN